MSDILVTMQEDLERALKKKPEERRWAMLLDLRKCVGCHACTIGCISENKLPPHMAYRPVYEYEQGKYPHVSRSTASSGPAPARTSRSAMPANATSASIALATACCPSA